MNPEFIPFEKIARYSNQVVITEKLDGTNAQIYIEEAGNEDQLAGALAVKAGAAVGDSPLVMYAGSRNRWVATEPKSADNYGFARWVKANSEELFKLGPGRHFGEWWGQGIARTYGLLEKRFSLFNAGRWTESLEVPSCVSVVPVLFQGRLEEGTVNSILSALKEHGSRAAPGFMNPEGIILFHTASRTLYKKTFEKDEGKWAP